MKKPIAVCLIPLILLTPLAMAIDFSTFETTCTEIGFKRNTETFGDCVLELASRAKKANEKKAQLQAQEEQQRQYENQRQREIAAQRQQQEQQAYQLRQQQAQLEAQQAQNRADNASAAMLFLLGAAAGAYNKPAPPPLFISPPSPPINCTSSFSRIGNSVDTHCW